MLEPIVEFFEKLATDLSWRRIAVVIFIFSLLSVIAYVYESYSRHVALSRLSTEVGLLERMMSLSNGDVDDELIVIKSNLTARAEALSSTTAASVALPPWLLKLGPAVLPWLCLGLLMVAADGIQQSRIAVSGMSAIAVPFVIASVVVPDHHWLLNYIIYPWALMFVALLAVMAINRISSRLRAKHN